ncbi:restriction endonuclease subunit S [Flavobacteriaceae bacterium]|nr:restriction endonuclease subunit S [Flavobacteriaceae bacterium]
MNWEIRKFGDVVEFPPKVKLDKKELYSFIPMDEVEAGRKYVGHQYLKEWKGSGGARFEEGDTLFARITPCLQNGKIAQAKGLINGKGFGSTEFFIFRGIEGTTDTDFVYYLSINSEFSEYAIGSMVGASGRQRADTKFVGEYEFNLPPLPTQRRIANILSAYDDLIENNLKRIKLLEQAAQNIYKEWFVNLRFPGHENTPINEETGLPEGWEELLMEDVMNVSGGGTPSTKEPLYWEEGNVLWFSPTDLNKNNSLVLIDSTKKITKLGLKKSSAKLVPKRTILMSSRATIGLFGLFNGECSTNQGFININPKEESLRYYILFNLKSRVEELIANASGATFKELSKRVFKRMSIVSPDSNISTNFYNQVELFINQTENLEFQNQKLKAARDILLPRLMNRTIEA